MQRAVGAVIVSLLCATAASGVCLAQAPPAAPPAPPQVQKWVNLNKPSDLEHLRATNPGHYLRAQKIIAAANEICQPGAAQPSLTRFNAASVSCQSMLWLTSLPPKKLLSFQLDDVRYAALVRVSVVDNKLIDGPAQGVPIQGPELTH